MLHAPEKSSENACVFGRIFVRETFTLERCLEREGEPLAQLSLAIGEDFQKHFQKLMDLQLF